MSISRDIKAQKLGNFNFFLHLHELRPLLKYEERFGNRTVSGTEQER